MTGTLDELLAEQRQARIEHQEAAERLDRADQAVLAKRFEDWGLLAEGDTVLVPRKMFGRIRMWPARIVAVHLGYREGEDANGEPWISQTASYSVYLKQEDGTFGGTSEVFWHSEVQPLIVQEEAS